MNFSDIPSRILKAFGVNGLKNPIATDSNTTTDSNGTATYDKGFPAITMTPLSAGGIPPSGRDMNGVLYNTTLKQQWSDAGMGYVFNNDFAGAISGYPRGATIPGSQLDVAWLNTLDGNVVNPESTTSPTNWVPAYSYGVTTISGLSSSSVTLTPMQSAKDRIILTGNLTSNISINFPAWMKSWTVVNNCSGNFVVICKTTSGSGISVSAGSTEKIYSDGVNILRDFGSAAMRNVGNGALNVPDMSYFPGNSAANGYSSSPSGGGTKTVWGNVLINAGTSFPNQTDVVFDSPFQSAPYAIFLSILSNNVGKFQVSYSLPTATGFKLHWTSTSALTVDQQFFYQAIGR